LIKSDLTPLLVDKKLGSNTIWGNIATSEMLPNSKEQVGLLKKSGYDIAEMEGAGFMQICWFYHKQCLVIRGVSNNTDEPITIEDVGMSAKSALDVLNQILS
jgi:nucleoside phosphorylase